MSIVGLSSYFLWTQKGYTLLPLVRGSGFVCGFHNTDTFYHHHVMTAGHVSCPPHYKHIYNNSIIFNIVRERHVSAKLLTVEPSTCRVSNHVDLQFKQHYCPNTDVASLRCVDESLLAERSIVPFQFDTNPLTPNEEVELCGVNVSEYVANPTDEDMCLSVLRLPAVCKAIMATEKYGTVLLTSLLNHKNNSDAQQAVSTSSSSRSSSTEELLTLSKIYHQIDGIENIINIDTSNNKTHEPREKETTLQQIPLSMCGGPVLRASNGKCVGVLVARVRNQVMSEENSEEVTHVQNIKLSSAQYNNETSRKDADSDISNKNSAGHCSDNCHRSDHNDTAANLQCKIRNKRLEAELDLTDNVELQSCGVLHAAFVPITEVWQSILKSEL